MGAAWPTCENVREDHAEPLFRLSFGGWALPLEGELQAPATDRESVFWGVLEAEIAITAARFEDLEAALVFADLDGNGEGMFVVPEDHATARRWAAAVTRLGWHREAPLAPAAEELAP